jgi:hypothetical protein
VTRAERHQQLDGLGEQLALVNVDLAAEHRLLVRDLAPRLEALGFDVGDKMRPLSLPSPSEVEHWRTKFRRPPHPDLERRAEDAYAKRRLVRYFTPPEITIR